MTTNLQNNLEESIYEENDNNNLENDEELLNDEELNSILAQTYDEQDNDLNNKSDNMQNDAQNDEAFQNIEAVTENNEQLPKQSPPFVAFIKNFFSVIFRPSHFWKVQQQKIPSYGEILWPHLIVLLFIRTVAGFVGMIWRSEPLIDSLIKSASFLISIFIAVWLLAMIFGSIASITGAKLSFIDAFRFVAYSITPMIFIGFLAVIPISPLFTLGAELVAMPFTFYVMGTGLMPILDVKPEKAPAITGLFCGILLCLWGLMPTLIPWLVSFIISHQ